MEFSLNDVWFPSPVCDSSNTNVFVKLRFQISVALCGRKTFEAFPDWKRRFQISTVSCEWALRSWGRSVLKTGSLFEKPRSVRSFYIFVWLFTKHWDYASILLWHPRNFPEQSFAGVRIRGRFTKSKAGTKQNLAASKYADKLGALTLVPSISFKFNFKFKFNFTLFCTFSLKLQY